MRVITTTYVGATERRALDRLVELGAEVRVSLRDPHDPTARQGLALSTRNRRWTRRTSAPRTCPAPRSIDGVEWNVRLSSVDQPHLIDTFAATFDEYWDDPAFEEYDPARDRDRLRQALGRRTRRARWTCPSRSPTLEVRPCGYQAEVLDELDAERRGSRPLAQPGRDGHRHRKDSRGRARLPAAARPLEGGSLAVRRAPRGDPEAEPVRCSGKCSARRHVRRAATSAAIDPRQWRHVFAICPVPTQMDLTEVDPTRFDMVIIDEFHHAEAPTYSRLLDHLHAPRAASA